MQWVAFVCVCLFPVDRLRDVNENGCHSIDCKKEESVMIYETIYRCRFVLPLWRIQVCYNTKKYCHFLKGNSGIICQSRVFLLSSLSFIINVFFILLSLLSNACSTSWFRERIHESTLEFQKFFWGEGVRKTKKPKWNSKWKWRMCLIFT
jgi:hypothetical protein